MVGYGASTAMADLTITGGSCTRNINWAGFLLGFALGGFFDGILLHQILQWHHLLSGLQGERFVDIRVQILADGGFHALMYVLAIVGLWLLWKTRRQCTEPGAGRALLAMAMIGFGVWHVADSIISHWLMGIHRIRMDSSNPLMWDLIWLFAFGVVPLLVGLWLKRKPSGGAPSRGTIAAAVLAFCSLAGGAVAALPSPNVSQAMVYFRPGTTVNQVVAAADAAGARIIWSDALGELWAFDFDDVSRSRILYRHGALFIGSSLFPVGCLAACRPLFWRRVPVA